MHEGKNILRESCAFQNKPKLGFFLRKADFWEKKSQFSELNLYQRACGLVNMQDLAMG